VKAEKESKMSQFQGFQQFAAPVQQPQQFAPPPAQQFAAPVQQPQQFAAPVQQPQQFAPPPAQQFAAPVQQPQQFAAPVQQFAAPVQQPQQFAAPVQQPQQFAPPPAQQFAAPVQQPQQFAPPPAQQWGSPAAGAFGGQQAPVSPALGAFPAAGRPAPGFAGPSRAAFDPSSLAGFDAASSRRNASYIKPCHGLFKILQVELGRSQGNGDFFVLNLACIHDFQPENYRVASGDKDPGYGHQVGEQCSIMHMSKFRTFFGNVKADLKAILGLSDEQITTQVVQWVAGPENPLRDVVIEVSASVIVTKEKKQPFTAPTIRGRVAFSAVKAFLLQTDPGRIDRFFPNGQLDQLIAMEQGAGR
jgi:hypothetical protein